MDNRLRTGAARQYWGLRGRASAARIKKWVGAEYGSFRNPSNLQNFSNSSIAAHPEATGSPLLILFPSAAAHITVTAGTASHYPPTEMIQKLTTP
jgi:hypothetical protein